MASLLVLDDDADLRLMLREHLEAQGHVVREAGDGETLARLVDQDGPPDLVVLDLNLPGESGLRIAARLRTLHDCGIVMLTGAVAPIDRVLGLEVGADDYVAKPVDLRELDARIAAVLRRRRPPVEADWLPFGPYRFDLKGFCLRDGEGRMLPLKEMELDLVAAFATRPGRVLSRDDLLRLAPARGDDTTDRSIDKRITRLRQKLERRPEHPELIKTVRGGGYVFGGSG
jgi:DNA-binding response OmpR family regulator